MTGKEIEFSNEVFSLAYDIRNIYKEKEFLCPICKGKAILKISGDMNQKIWAYCDNCETGSEGVIYD
jgi:ribosomal protein L37AE/L43A